jgi:diketogulonate reductase-like aldo/keto reductase
MINRRKTLKLGVYTGAAAFASQSLLLNATEPVHQEDQSLSLIQRPIPSSSELLPVIGMGTSRTFDEPDNKAALENLAAVMSTFADGKGTLIDSSPMYGRAEERVGDILQTMQPKPPVFAATKVWTKGRRQGLAQMQASAERMKIDRFDLIAVHNLVDWKIHLETLKQWKEEGKVRYIGITTSHGRDHEDFLQVMRKEPLDFVQFSYNIEDRVAEKYLLPLAADRGIATMINRPFQRGSLFKKVKGMKLPDWTSEFDCHSWSQFFLKFILSHPASTCIIPATNKVHHMQDNMGANFGRLPTSSHKAQMLDLLNGSH